MPQTFILKSSDGSNLGEINYFKKQFKINISLPEDKKQIEDLLGGFLKEGIWDLGEIILREPIKPGDPLFLNEVRNQLARAGYILIKKK